MIESNFTQDISVLKKLPKTWGVFDFGTVFTDISGGNKKFLKSNFQHEGKVAIVDQGKDLIAGYTNEEDKVVKGQPPYIVFGDHTRIFKFIDFPFVMGADGTKVLKVKDIKINNEKFDIVINLDIWYIVELIKTKNIFIYVILINDQIICAYFYIKSCTFIEKGLEVLSCFASINNCES